MFRLVRKRLIVNTIRESFMKDMKSQRCASSKDEKSRPLCAEPPQPPSSIPPVDPPPCPPPPPPCGPPCPPPICTVIPDPNNPCNYVPPENPDPADPDMTKIKRLQCLYQQDDDIPFYLKGGKHKAYFFQFVTILGFISFLGTIRSAYLLLSK